MNDADARRILALGPDADTDEIRRAFARQLRALREARAAAQDPMLRARHDRALDLTVRASRHLLDSTRDFAATQELPAVRRWPRIDRRIVAAGVGGALLTLAALLLPPPDFGPEGDEVQVPVPVSKPEPEPVMVPIPERRSSAPAVVADKSPPAGPDRAWFDPLHAALAAGEAGPGRLARLLETAGAAVAADATDWHRQALDRGNGASGMWLAGQVLGETAPEALDERRRARALHWYQRAATAFATQGDAALAQSWALEAMALLVATDPASEPPRAARHLLECRRLRETREALPCIRPGEIGARLEARALESGDWGRVRWWYEQAVSEREPAGARGLARILALGRTGEIERRRALALIEDVAERWEDFRRADAAAAAAGLSDIWSEGWGVAPDPAQASWWASQAARLGDGRAALRLATAFALGIGTQQDLQRAQNLVAIFSEPMPLFEVAFLRSVGRHLVAGDGVAADPQRGRAWLRRAFQRCRALGKGSPDARLELASMYFSGDGVEADAGRAARMYADLLEHAPRVAGNMLAWIRATHPDPALRDGEEALRIARRLVKRPSGSGPSSADLHDTLAAALAEAGDPAEAVTVQQRALGLLEQEATPGLAGLDIAERRAGQQRRLAAYRSGRPWRDPEFTHDSTRNTG